MIKSGISMRFLEEKNGKKEKAKEKGEGKRRGIVPAVLDAVEPRICTRRAADKVVPRLACHRYGYRLW